MNGIAVNEPFDLSLVTDHGLGGGALPFTLTLGPGDNCYDPNCQVDTEVDSGGAINESDESNNTDSRLDLG